MVAKTVDLPNIRELFIPDKGYLICDCDLAQADARVVAWDAKDEELKEVFKSNEKDLHTENAKAIFGEVDKEKRSLAKRGVHATNYGITVTSLAKSLNISFADADRFQAAWFESHPKIKEWHDSVEYSLQTTRSVSNAFGHRMVFWDRIESLLPEALAWIPQSTVALITNKALKNLDDTIPEVQILLQVHDSVVFQVPIESFEELKPKIKKALEVVVPYDDPLIIPPGLEVSEKSWGDCKNNPQDW